MINGESYIKILLFNILPLLKNTILVIFTTSIAQVSLMEASLSFLGVGVKEPNASLGSMLSVALDIMNLHQKAYMWLPQLILILCITISSHLIGEGLSENA